MGDLSLTVGTLLEILREYPSDMKIVVSIPSEGLCFLSSIQPAVTQGHLELYHELNAYQGVTEKEQLELDLFTEGDPYDKD